MILLTCIYSGTRLPSSNGAFNLVRPCQRPQWNCGLGSSRRNANGKSQQVTVSVVCNHLALVTTCFNCYAIKNLISLIMLANISLWRKQTLTPTLRSKRLCRWTNCSLYILKTVKKILKFSQIKGRKKRIRTGSSGWNLLKIMYAN